MVVGQMDEAVDVVVVGGGPGGYAAAIRAAQAGREVVLVERDGASGLGGTCVRVGCIPSKAMIELANNRAAVEHMGHAGLRVEGARVDLAQFQVWKNSVVERLSNGVRGLLAAAKVRLVHGTARFIGPNRLVVATADDQAAFLQFRHAIVATGSRQVALPALPRDGVRVLDSTDALALDHLPARVAVVGGGYIGLELGSALAKLGSAVTIIEMTDRVLPSIDPALAKPVVQALRQRGVEVLLSTQPLGLDDAGLCVATTGGEQVVPVTHVIVAAGRRPTTDDLGLAEAGARTVASGHVEVDLARLATRTIAAIGDVTLGPALAHKATAEADVAVDAICGKRAAFDPAAIPAVVFTDPEITTVGLTEGQARDAGLDVTSVRFPLSASGRAATLSAPRGHANLVVDRDGDIVVGAHLVGPHVSELAGEITLAIEMAASADDLAATIHPHPTMSESIREAAEMALGRPLHAT